MDVQFKGRREDYRLVTGQGKYTSDWSFPDEASGFFLRSDRAHAKIVSLDASAALALLHRILATTAACCHDHRQPRTIAIS